MNKAQMKKLRAYCKTDRQKEVVEACIKEGSQVKGALWLNTNIKSVNSVVTRVRQQSLLQGDSPEHDMNNPVPDGFLLKGTSTLYDKEGNVKIQWVKSTIDGERQKLMVEEAFRAFAQNLPSYPPVTASTTLKKHDIINQYTIADHHIGMLAWGEETGQDYDSEYAEQLLMRWFEQAIIQAPNSSKAIFAQLGDFLHYDGMEAVTPSSGHSLDSDSRFQKMVRISIRLMRFIVDKLLTKHDSVHIINVTGNHDLASSVWLREMVHHVYLNEPRVTVDLSPDVYYMYEFGKTSLFYHHGHKRRVHNVSDVLVSKFREVFGRTTHSYCHMGHLHHKDVKENNMMIVEQHRTLASPDAYSSQGGYLSGSDAQVITYHKKYGEVGRTIISKELIEEESDTNEIK